MTERNMSVSSNIDLSAYLERIDYSGSLEPSHSTLESLHFAHATHIPFENLDVLLKRPIRLDIESLQDKMVRNRRGGYCFEHNLLFSAVLKELGFSVTQLAARVRYRSNRIPPRTHMLLLVDIDGSQFIADVGFGAEGLLLPIPFINNKPVQQHAWTYRIIDEDKRWILQSFRDNSWSDLYVFTLEPQYQIDYEVASHYVSTHPDSRFTQTLTVQQTLPDVRRTIRNNELIIDDGTTITSHQIQNDDHLLRILDQTFGLQFPKGTTFHYKNKAS